MPKKPNEPNDYSRLPLWARQEIDRLNAGVEYWKRKAEQATGGTEAGAIAIIDGTDVLGHVSAGGQMQFPMPLGGFIQVAYAREPNELRVYATECRLVVVPEVANTLRIRAEEL